MFPDMKESLDKIFLWEITTGRIHPGWINGIEDHYKIPGEFTENTVSVSIYDLGPCVTESTGVSASLNNYQFGKYLDTTESKINFHGYPAIHVIRTIIRF